VEGTALGEKMSLLPFDPPACLENEEKKKKPRNLETFNVEPFWIGGPNSSGNFRSCETNSFLESWALGTPQPQRTISCTDTPTHGTVMLLQPW
jgi:hypothetical protein